MKLSLVFILLVFAACWACDRPQHQQALITQEVQQLKTNKQKRAYLEQIMKDDQAVRGEEGSNLMLAYGKDSEEYMDFVKTQWAQDELNLKKVEAYFAAYGYPDQRDVGRDAGFAPWLVIQHCTDPGTRNSFFEILYEAYLDKKLRDTEITFYLNRTYDFLFDERLVLENPYTTEDEINKLVTALELEDQKAKIDQAFNTR